MNIGIHISPVSAFSVANINLEYCNLFEDHFVKF